MKFQPPPTDENKIPFIPSEVFELCVSMVRNRAIKKRLRAIRPDIEAESEDYDAKALYRQLYRKEPHNHVGEVSGDEMVKVYTLRMVPKKSRGRSVYNRIMSAPVNGRCPLCGIGTVNTLDHYLPKTHFPVYSVTPNNLIPVCNWCQVEKSEYYATRKDGQLLHPYFDNKDNEVWLEAEVVEGTPAAFRYFASPPAHWARSEKGRVKAHLKELNLPLLFSSNAGSRLSEIRGRLKNLYQKGGADAVSAHLNEELTSIEADHINSWVAAMYRAAIINDWFCNGGFLET